LRISVIKSGLEISDALGNVGLKVRETLVEGEVDKAWHGVSLYLVVLVWCTAPKQDYPFFVGV